MVTLSRGQRICTHVRLIEPATDAGSRVFGDVWMAADEETGGRLWLTVIDESFLPSIFEVSEFMAKANALARLRHPDLVRVALVDREETYCIVGYEVLDGARLFSELLLREKLHPEKVMRRATAVARGLAYLHGRGVVHGALSPATTFEWEGSTVAWQYGLVSAVDPGVLGQRCRLASDEELFPPELHRGAVGPAGDVWAWGRLVAEMASGLSALEAVNEALDGGRGFEADPRLIELVQACLSADPSARPRDAEQLVERLESIRRSGAVVGLPSTLAPPPPKASTGAVPSLEAGIPDESGDYLELEDVDVVESGGHRLRRNRPGDSTAGLKALALDTLGDSLPRALDKVLAIDGDAHETDPHLVELAQQGAAASGLAAPSIEVGLRASERAGLDELSSGLVPAAAAYQAPRRPLAEILPRRPGPHGPAPRPMILGLVGLSLALVALPALHVAAERAPTFAESAPTRTGSDPGGPGEPAAATIDASPVPQASAPPAPPELPPPEPCPGGMLPLDERVCMDVAEYPGLRRVPQVAVTLRQAATLCERRDARLCSFAEWSRACAGTKGRRFPYGPSAQADRCNTASIAGFPQELAAAGAYADCVTAEGFHDLVGNVGEWAAEGIAVGGDSSTPIAEATCKAKGRPPKGFSGPDLGFRCCMDRGPLGR